jgi:hypothetical protein
VDQMWAPGGQPKQATFVYLNDRPVTTVTMSIDPPEATEFFSLVVNDNTAQATPASPITISPIKPHPHSRSLPVGLYQLAAKFTKNDPRYKEAQVPAVATLPASRPWRVKVK